MMAWPKTHFQKHRVRAALVPFHCDGKLREIIERYPLPDGRYGITFLPPRPKDTRTVAERERDLYERAMRGG